MRLLNLHIDGFGIFREVSVESLPAGLSIFLGDNETGKSTLLAFLRAVLFGFEGRRPERNRYEPLRGGRHGGYIEIETDCRAPYRLQRTPEGGVRGTLAVINLSTGLAEQDALEGIMGRATEDVYRNVFAFSLRELQDFESLRGSQVRGRMLTAGAGTGPVSVVDVERALEREAGELFAPRAQRPLNLALNRLEEVKARLRELGQNLEEYQRLRSEIESLKTQISEMKKSEGQLRRELGEAETAQKAWEDWVMLCQARDGLESLDPVNQFPEEGVRRLDALKAGVEGFVQQVKEREDDNKLDQKRLSELVSREELVRNAEEIRRLVGQRERLQVSLHDLPIRQGELDILEANLVSGLRDLGPEWSEARLREFDASVAVVEECRAHRDSLSGLKRAEEDAKRELERLEGEQRRAEALELQARQRWEVLSAETAPFPQSLEEKEGALKAARNQMAELRDAETDHKHCAERAADFRAGAEAGEREASSPPLRLPAWAGLALFAAFAVPTALFWGEWSKFGVLLALAIGSPFAWVWLSQTLNRQADARRQHFRAEAERLNEQAEESEGKASSARERIQECRRNLEGFSELLGRPLEAEAAMGEAEAQLRKQREAWERCSTAREKLAELEKARAEALEAAQKAETKLREAEKKWQGWLGERQLRLDLSPESLMALLARVQAERAQLGNIDQLRGRIQGIRRDLAQIAAQAGEVFRNCGREAPPLDELVAALDRLSLDLNDSLENKIAREEIERVIEGRVAATHRLDEQIKESRGQFASLLAEAGVEGEEEFRRRAALFQRRRDLEAEVDQRETNLAKIDGRDWRQRLETKLNTTTPEEIDSLLQERRVQLEGCVSMEAEKRTALGGAQEQLKNLERSEEQSALLLERERVSEEGRRLSERWCILTLARSLLQMARNKYDREHQSSVIQKTQAFFKTITGGDYLSVYSPLGEDSITLENAQHEHKELNHLSRGTAEQLYLSLRFGCVKEYNRLPNSEPLPVVMDEVLVNFDPRRALHAAEAIMELAESNQVLFFTCHPESVEKFRRLNSALPVFRLAEGKIQPR